MSKDKFIPISKDTYKPPNFREVEYKSCSECENYTYNYRLEEGLCTKYDWEVSENLVQICDDWEKAK